MDVGDVGPHQLGERQQLAAAVDVQGDGRADLAPRGPVGGIERGGEGQRDELVLAGEILATQPFDVAGILVLRPGRAGAVPVDRADARFLEAADRGVGVLGRVRDVRPVQQRGDPGVQRAPRAQEVAGVHVVGAVDPAGRRADVAEVVRIEPAVGQDVAELSLPGVPVGIDEARHDDHGRRVDLARRRPQIRPDRGDLAALDQHVGPVEVAQRGVHGEDHAALEQDALARRAGRRRPRGAPRQRGARRPRQQPRGAGTEKVPAGHGVR